MVDIRRLRILTEDDLLEWHLRTETVFNRGAAYETACIKCLRRTSLARLSLVAATRDKFAAYRDRPPDRGCLRDGAKGNGGLSPYASIGAPGMSAAAARDASTKPYRFPTGVWARRVGQARLAPPQRG